MYKTLSKEAAKVAQKLQDSRINSESKMVGTARVLPVEANEFRKELRGAGYTKVNALVFSKGEKVVTFAPAKNGASVVITGFVPPRAKN